MDNHDIELHIIAVDASATLEPSESHSFSDSDYIPSKLLSAFKKMSCRLAVSYPE